MVYLFLANGFEEVEAITPVDILRRAGVEVSTVAVVDSSDKTVTGAHGIDITADISLTDINYDDIDAVILPGGMPGTRNLDASEDVRQALKYCFDNDRLICAICAAPSVLGHLGFLKGKKATCFPGFERELHAAVFTGAEVTVDGKIITADGPGAAMKFGEAIAAQFVGIDAAKRVTDSMQCRY